MYVNILKKHGLLGIHHAKKIHDNILVISMLDKYARNNWPRCLLSYERANRNKINSGYEMALIVMEGASGSDKVGTRRYNK